MSRKNRKEDHSSRPVRISKALSYLLRHEAGRRGLPITPDGYIELDLILRQPELVKYKPSAEEIFEIVETNDKRRFALQAMEDGWYIRANQGHSKATGKFLDDDKHMTLITDASTVPFCYHGTTDEAWESISRTGLRPMSRKHVHFASKPYNSSSVVSGARKSCTVLIHLDVEKAIAAGMKIYKSENDVLLTSGISGHILPSFFKSVERRERNGSDFKPVPPSEYAISDDAALSLLAASLPEEEKGLSYLLVLDFEATCDNDRSFKPNEVIEFPVAILNTTTNQVVAYFHEYVRPTRNPILTSFCTELTGITQEMVDKADTYPEVYDRFTSFLQEHGMTDANGDKKVSFSIATCGDWDFKTMFPQQMGLSSLSRPSWSSTWVNVKHSFAELTGTKARGLSSMLSPFGLSFKGRPHSGIDDVKNLVSICSAMVEKGFVFKPTYGGKIQKQGKGKGRR